jgi:hypothetical protein
LEDESGYVRSSATRKLTDKVLLAKIALEDESGYVRSSATRKLTDKVLLAKIALEDENSGVRLAATRKLTDTALLAKTVLEDENSEVRLAAVEKLTDQDLLTKIALKDKNFYVRKAVFLKLSEAKLIKLSTSSENLVLQIAAKMKLLDLTWDKVYASYDLQVALGSIALLDKQSINESTVNEACRRTINKGLESLIPELKEMLRLYGNMSLAQDYLNSGKSGLTGAAIGWAFTNGYFLRSSGPRSSLDTWGNGR